MGSFNQKIWLSLSTVELRVLIFLSVIYFNFTQINAPYVYSVPNTKYSPHHYYNLVSPLPNNMQLRRFMWSNDNTMGDFYKDVSSGAHVMRQLMMGSFAQPSIIKFKNYFPHASPSNHIKYMVRKPKKIVHVKKNVPKKIIKILTIPTPQPAKPFPTQPSVYKFHQGIDKDKYINPEQDHVTTKDTLRMIEEEEERRVEATISALFPINIHDSNKGDYNIVSGKIEEFDDSWKPITMDGENIEQPKRSHQISPLHINVDDYVHLKNQKKVDNSQYDVTDLNLKNEKISEKLQYEVTELSAEESMQLPQAFRPQKMETNRFTKENVINSGRISSTSSAINNRIRNNSGSSSTTTTNIAITSDKPNYPDYYLETFARDYQVDCATKTPLIWKNINKKDTSSRTLQKETNIQNISTQKKERQTNIHTATTEKPVKLKPMRKYSSKIKKKSLRSTIKPQIKTDEPIYNQQEIQKYVTIKDNTNELQAIPTAFTTRVPEDLVRYITTTSTLPSTTIASISKVNKFDKERIKKIRGAKKFGEKERL